MAASKSNHIRSISFPSRSHPNTLRVEEELNKLKTLLEITVDPTVETICNGLIGLEELHKCIDDLLNLPQTLVALSHHHKYEKLVEDLLDNSVRLLDVCGTVKELVSQYKENVRDLQSSLRRRKGDSGRESSIDALTSFNKKMKKDVKKLVSALKQVNQETEVSVVLDENQDTVDVIRVLRESNTVCSSIFQMLLSFLSVPLLKSTSSKWSLVSRLVPKGRKTCEGQEESTNLESKLESFEARLESFENGLERTFRCLVGSRSSLLNILSC